MQSVCPSACTLSPHLRVPYLKALWACPFGLSRRLPHSSCSPLCALPWSGGGGTEHSHPPIPWWVHVALRAHPKCCPESPRGPSKRHLRHSPHVGNSKSLRAERQEQWRESKSWSAYKSQYPRCLFRVLELSGRRGPCSERTASASLGKPTWETHRSPR